jgi:branched-chain amino acid transport system ATP-binding protein
MRMRRGICQSPEGRQVFGPLSIEDNLRLGAYTQPKGQVEGDLEKIFAMFPILKEKRACRPAPCPGLHRRGRPEHRRHHR